MAYLQSAYSSIRDIIAHGGYMSGYMWKKVTIFQKFFLFFQKKIM